MIKKEKKKKRRINQNKRISLKLTGKQKILFGSLLMLLSVAFFIAFVSFFITWKADQSILTEFTNKEEEAKNWLSKFGASISYFFIYKGIGLAAFIFPTLTFRTGLYFFLSSQLSRLINRWFWGIFIGLWISLFFGFFSQKAPLLGGIIGYEINDFLRIYIGRMGIILVLLFLLIVYLVFRIGLTPQKMNLFFIKIKKGTLKSFKTATHHNTINTSDNTHKATVEKNEVLNTSIEHVLEIDVDRNTTANDIKNTFKIEAPIEKESTKNIEEPTLEIEIENTLEEPKESSEIAAQLVKDFGPFDPRLELSNYTFPNPQLLNDYGAGTITIDQEELEENKNKIVDTLKNYKIEISQIKATIGPTVTLYEIVPAAGIRISKIKSLEDDIALSLSALGIRIIAPIPGKGTIGIEVPNKKSSIVSMKSVLTSKKFQDAEMELPIAFGKNISNETFVVDLAKMPHLLMAGATGQGKSVGLNAILTSLLYKKHPAEVKFILVDPKKVELTLFNKIERHFLAKLPDSEEAIITDNTKVINTLNSLCIEMDNRYEMLKNAMVRNIKEYNQKFKKRILNPNDGHLFLPYIVLVIDEFADLIMTAGKEVETPIARLAQLARAVGIHLIIATQRPSVNVITGIIKANFPGRVAFRVTSKIDSRTILDLPGADQLIGRGDMLYTQGNDLIRLQCAFVDTPEVEKITEFIGSQRAFPNAHLLPEYIGEESGTGIDIDVSERDALFKEAAEVIVTAQQGSASLLQRKLKLGYNRAGRIIDQLEAAGIVGPFEGSKARQVLVTDLIALNQLLESEI